MSSSSTKIEKKSAEKIKKSPEKIIVETMEWTARRDRSKFRDALTDIGMNGSQLCRDFSLLSYFFTTAMDTSQWVVVARKNDQIAGFAIIQKIGRWKAASVLKSKSKSVLKPRRVPKRMLLNLICSTGMGSKLLEEIKHKSKALGANILELHAVVPAIGFYLRQGFTLARPGKCQQNERINDLAKKIPLALWKDEEKALKNKRFRHFLNVLREEGAIPSPCKKIYECNQDGYVMNYCLQ